MKPYFEDTQAGIVIYHGDCREILPSLEAQSSNLTLTDPPYNVGKDYGGHNDAMSDTDYEVFMRAVATECQRVCPNQAWVAPRYKMRLFTDIFPSAHLVVVRRGATGPYRGGWSDQFETLLTIGKPNQCVPDLWDNIRLKGEGYFFREETYEHPGYTPYPIMAKCVGLLSTDSVLDPFCGTGTSLRAAKDLGRTAIGIELNEAYCDIAANRLRQEVLVFT